jgi:16S rRNA (cytosine967-C5)-methyltransferase
VARFGAEATERLLIWNNSLPGLVLQPARWTLAELERALRAAGVPVQPAPWGSGLVVRATRPAELPGFREGGFFVQDPSQHLVVRYFDVPAGAVVYDACAAPGGKSLSLARTASLVLAADRQRHRVRRLAENLRRASPGRAFPLVADATHPPLRRADAVVLDVPCLGTGAFARNPDARWRVTPAALQSLVAQAAGFLEVAADLVAPGGLLLFATCSLEPEENEEQIDRFLFRDPRFSREPPRAMPAELVTPDGDLMILPQRDGIDGAYAVRLHKRSG